MTEPKIHVALVGAGRIGKIHAENLATRVRGAELAAIADVNLAAAQILADEWNVTRVADDYRSLLDDETINAVLIASATDTHASIIEHAAAAGKHIFCEKPIAHDLAEIDRALAAVARAGVKLQIGFNRRFDPNFHKARALIAAGRIGAPYLLHIISRDPAPPPLDYLRVSGGIFLDMTIHDFDMARFLIGSEVCQVFATGSVRVDPQISTVGDIDTAVTVLWFENGVIGTIDNCRAASYGYDQRVEVFGANGAVAVANETPDEAILSDREGIHASLPHYFFLERYTEAYVQELRAFVRAIRENSAPPVTGRDGRIPVVMGLAAIKSLNEHRPVRLDEIDKG
ncbi:MAG: inositol 2-dehydrogenase [Chloroflexi bacterium]|nr:inositol 2-dehydrogenase [Chloroflexota bacterium]